MKFAAEALRNITDESVSKKLFFFNTFEFGPELNFSLNLNRGMEQMIYQDDMKNDQLTITNHDATKKILIHSFE